jgi:hypothetical protein
MAFTHEKPTNRALMAVARLAANELAEKDQAFAQKMGMLGPRTTITFSNQQYVPIFHTPPGMETSLGRWLKKENIVFKPVKGENFFLSALKDPQNRENYFLFYFHFLSNLHPNHPEERS